MFAYPAVGVGAAYPIRLEFSGSLIVCVDITSSWVGYNLPELRQSSAQLEYLWVGLGGEAEAAAAASGDLAMVSAGFTGEVRWVETLFFVLVLFVWSVDLAEAFTLALEMILIIFLTLGLPLCSMS